MTPSAPIRILFMDDDAGQARLARRTLAHQAHAEGECAWLHTAPDHLSASRTPHL
jgi:hypothetical protein